MLLTSVYILATRNKEHDSAPKARAKYSYIIVLKSLGPYIKGKGTERLMD